MHVALRRPIVWLVATAIAAALMVMSPMNASPAEAQTNCSVSHYYWSTAAMSAPQTCQARTFLDCRHNTYPYITQRVWGPWVRSPQASWAYCPGGFSRYYSWYQTLP